MQLVLLQILLSSLPSIVSALTCANSTFHFQQNFPLQVTAVPCEGMCMKSATWMPGDQLIHFERACVPVVMDTEIGCETNFGIQMLEPKLINCYCDTDLCNF